MATERTAPHDRSRDEPPSRRTVLIPLPGTDEAALLDNLNEVYGEPDPADEHVVAGIRQALREVLEHER
jgi:hypothetical protein